MAYRWLSAGTTLLLIVSLAGAAVAASDYITQAPPTVYETGPPNPENMDYDRANKMFVAHPGYYKDRLIHYYKFRMFTPDTYPNSVVPGKVNIPVAPLYLLTTTGGFDGIVKDQKPILRYHFADGEKYSDFVEVYWVKVAPGYAANTFRSWGDIEASGIQPVPSGIYANVPVVPTGSKLEDPQGGVAPIQPLMAWYRGAEVQTFVFETTDSAFAGHFNPLTRTGRGLVRGGGYDITVAPFVSEGGKVAAPPILHVNHYFFGVTPGVNNGGPAKTGQRNVIGVDRGDAGYSPLWQVMWVTKLPLNYQADQASSVEQFTEANGFGVEATPMFVNCPDVGPPGGTTSNEKKAVSFSGSEVRGGETVTLRGALVMMAGEKVSAFLGSKPLASATTGMMGEYAISIPVSDLPAGPQTISVKDSQGSEVQTFALNVQGQAPGTPAPTPRQPGFGGLEVLAGLALAATLVALFRPSRGARQRK